MSDPFRPLLEPQRTIYDAFQDEATKRHGRAVYKWQQMERLAVWRAARAYAITHDMTIPSLSDVEAAKRSAIGHIDYGLKWACGVAEAMRKPPHNPQGDNMSTIDDLKAEVRRLEDQLRDTKRALHNAMIESHPVKVGTIGLSGKDVVIVSSLRICYDEVRVYGRRKTKTGWHGTEVELFRGFTPTPKEAV